MRIDQQRRNTTNHADCGTAAAPETEKSPPEPAMDNDPVKKPFYRSLYFQVITAIVIGVLLGHFFPQTGEAMKPLGDGFIKLIKMIIAPIIFC
ncbi:MAG: cation:dicarboxylase symporter family transporter, partial [Burkholderiales bacterium]